MEENNFECKRCGERVCESHKLTHLEEKHLNGFFATSFIEDKFIKVCSSCPKVKGDFTNPRYLPNPYKCKCGQMWVVKCEAV